MTKGKWPSLSSLKLCNLHNSKADNNISACGVDYIALGNWKNLNYIYLGILVITKIVINSYFLP